MLNDVFDDIREYIMIYLIIVIDVYKVYICIGCICSDSCKVTPLERYRYEYENRSI